MLRHSLVLILGLLLAGCAAQSAAPDVGLAAPAAKSRPDTYELSKVELGYDCAKLTGHMKVRISQLRGTADRTPTTSASRSMHQMATIAGGSAQGIDPVADRARDRLMLDAYNRQLAAKSCKPLEIDAELNGQPTPGGGKPEGKATPAAAKKS